MSESYFKTANVLFTEVNLDRLYQLVFKVKLKKKLPRINYHFLKASPLETNEGGTWTMQYHI